MDGGLALMGALAAFGGRWLRDGATDSASPLMLGNSCFQYVGSFVADIPKRRFGRSAGSAQSPEEWLARLRSTGVGDLALVTDLGSRGPLPSHIAVSFANGGTSGLLATGRSEPSLWSIQWEVGDREAADRRIWSLAAHRHDASGLAASNVTVAEARGRLSASLNEIKAFAEQYDEVSNWATWFAKSLALLDAPDPEPPYHRDILPPDAALERRQLAAAVVQGYVFGGMGSWNDCGFVDPQIQGEYLRVGADLHSALLFSVAAAVNGA